MCTGEAVFHGHTQLCIVLERASLTVTSEKIFRVPGGYTILHIAAASGHTHVLHWLLHKSSVLAREADAINDSGNSESLTPMHCMLISGRFSLAGLQVLVDAGADISITCAGSCL